MPTAAVLGSRGCPWNCSFCSIRPFYEAQGGALRRLRDPDAVVAEMRALHVERGVAVSVLDYLRGVERAVPPERSGVACAEVARELGRALGR